MKLVCLRICLVSRLEQIGHGNGIVTNLPRRVEGLYRKDAKLQCAIVHSKWITFMQMASTLVDTRKQPHALHLLDDYDII